MALARPDATGTCAHAERFCELCAPTGAVVTVETCLVPAGRPVPAVENARPVAGRPAFAPTVDLLHIGSMDAAGSGVGRISVAIRVMPTEGCLSLSASSSPSRSQISV